jgi:hypothetical protein
MKVVKFILGGLFLISALGMFGQKEFLTGLIFASLGLVFLPPISENLKQKFKLWQSKGIRYVAYIVLFFIAGAFMDKGKFSDLKTSQSEISNETKDKLPYQEYLNQVEQASKLLSKERIENRNNVFSEFKTNSIYQKLVVNKEVSQEYLILLDAISKGISNSKEDEFSIEESLLNKIQKSENGEDKMHFVTRVTGLSLPTNGGLTKEIIEVFERYKSKFGWYGSQGDVFMDGNMNKTVVLENFDLTPFFALIEPKDEEILSKLYEARQKGISNWNSKGNYLYPYMATKEGYMNYIKQINPDNPLIPKVDMEVTASELYRAYEANEVSADQQYKGKRLLITGVVENIGKDVMDNPYVALKIDFLKGVNCYFDDENNKVLSHLSKGQKIQIIGTCAGLTLTDVVVKDCELWE